MTNREICGTTDGLSNGTYFVWLENEESDTWHTSYGGGILLQPVLAPVTLHVIAADGKEGTRFYFGLGYPF